MCKSSRNHLLSKPVTYPKLRYSRDRMTIRVPDKINSDGCPTITVLKNASPQRACAPYMGILMRLHPETDPSYAGTPKQSQTPPAIHQIHQLSGTTQGALERLQSSYTSTSTEKGSQNNTSRICMIVTARDQCTIQGFCVLASMSWIAISSTTC